MLVRQAVAVLAAAASSWACCPAAQGPLIGPSSAQNGSAAEFRSGRLLAASLTGSHCVHSHLDDCPRSSTKSGHRLRSQGRLPLLVQMARSASDASAVNVTGNESLSPKHFLLLRFHSWCWVGVTRRSPGAFQGCLGTVHGAGLPQGLCLTVDHCGQAMVSIAPEDSCLGECLILKGLRCRPSHFGPIPHLKVTMAGLRASHFPNNFMFSSENDLCQLASLLPPC